MHDAKTEGNIILEPGDKEYIILYSLLGLSREFLRGPWSLREIFSWNINFQEDFYVDPEILPREDYLYSELCDATSILTKKNSLRFYGWKVM